MLFSQKPVLLLHVCGLLAALGVLGCQPVSVSPTGAKQELPRAQEPDSSRANKGVGETVPSVAAVNAGGEPMLSTAGPGQRAGRPTQAWALTQTDELSLPVSGYSREAKHYLEFWLYLPERVAAGRIGLSLGGRTDALPLAWVGWRRVSIPVAVMNKVKSPGEPTPPGQLRLQRVGEFPDDYTVYVQDVRMVPQSTGAGITEEDLLEHLDLTRPGLAAVAAAVKAGRKVEALKALAAHFRQDFTARMPLPSVKGDAEQTRGQAIAEGDKLLSGFVAHGDHAYTFPEGNIDWRFNPTLGKENFTYEWGFSLNRHAVWETLGKAYNKSSDDKYAELWARQFRRWVEQMPAPGIDEERGDSGWRGLEAGLRLARVWPAAFYAMAPSRAVKDADILLFLRSVIDHGNFLAGHPYGPGNHFLLAMCGLYTQGVVFPELKDAVFWRQHALGQLAVSLERNMVPEGAWYELAPGYHSWVVNRVMYAFRIAQTNGLGGEVPAALWERLQKMAEWNVLLVGPDGRVPTVNDGGQVIMAQAGAPGAAVFPDNALLKWAVSFNDAVAPAAPTRPASYALPDSGYTLLRTGWGRTDSYVLFDVGPLGGWHGHQDALNIVTYFFGRPFLFDNGGWAYDTSIWRKYGPTTAAHNTVLVDGLGQWRGFSREDPIGLNSPKTPAPVFATSAAVDYASGWYVGDYGKKGAAKPIAQHRRELALVKPTAAGAAPLLVVVDTLAPLDTSKHRYEVRWHLLSTRWEEDRKARVLWTADPGKPNLAVLALTGAEEFHADSAVKTPEVLGWSYDGQTGGPYPALTLRQALTGAGVKRVVTVFIPYQGDPGNPVTSVRRAGPNQWVIAIKGQAPVTLTLAEQSAGRQPSFTLGGVAWPQPE